MVTEDFQIHSGFADRPVRVCDNAVECSSSPRDTQTERMVSSALSRALPSLRYGAAADKGTRRTMEDVHLIVPFIDLPRSGHFELEDAPEARAFFGVFDGHGGAAAAKFVSEHLLESLLAAPTFPDDLSQSLMQAFSKSEHMLYTAMKAQQVQESGTTALAALIWGETLFIANVGDSRAVMCKRGKAIDLSCDHKPSAEVDRITKAGGKVTKDGFLGGHLAVSRAFGDYHYTDLKYPQRPAAGQRSYASATAGHTVETEKVFAWLGPLIAVPEVSRHVLHLEDEFLILACDGLWDVFSSQRAIEFARQKLREHNDPQKCSEALVEEAMRMHTSDNVSVLTICFGSDPPPKREFGVMRSISSQGLSRLEGALRTQ